MWEADEKKWNRFVEEGLDFDQDNDFNIKYDFGKTCKQFGPAYFEFLRINYTICKMEDLMSDDEFMRINRVDKKFFEKNKDKLYNESVLKD